MKILVWMLASVLTVSGTGPQQRTMKPLNDQEKRVILGKGTEAPFSGRFYNHQESGTYVCRQCGTALYRSADKFDSGCGWPSFDDEIPGAVKRLPDPDGRRTEIVCARCGGHLGHVFVGERLTPRNVRHCVNSLSLDFIPAADPDSGRTDVANNTAHGVSHGAASDRQPAPVAKSDTAIFAGGCFWGVEYMLGKQPGVCRVESGYTGGRIPNPTYEEVCTRRTGHAEAVRVVFDPRQVSYEELARLFFEIHDPTQVDRQGPDIGNQYRSEIFYLSPEQRRIAERLIGELRAKGYDVATRVTPASAFWPAEGYHQRYYERKGTLPYCHVYTKRF